jgi:hypothetical protein
MPKFVIERQYLLPIYQRLTSTPPTSRPPAKRRRRMMTGKAPRGTETAQVLRRSEIPEGLIEQIERRYIHAGSFIWEDHPEYGPRLEIPAKFTDDE